jgi:O-antigen/teichoic acid export membrane protein
MSDKTNNTIQAFWVGMGSLSSFALAIVSAAILSRYFDKAEYGTYRQILYVYNTLLVVFTAGLPRVFAYFLPRYPLEQGKHIVWKVSKMLFFFGMVFSVVLFTFSGLIAQVLKNPELATGLKYFSPIPMLLLPTLGIEGIFSTYKKTIYIAIYNSLTRILMLLFIVLPVILLKGTYLYAIYGWIAVSIISLIIAWYFKGIPFKNVNVKKATLSFKVIFSYSLPLVLASLAGTLMSSADQFYISRFYGPNVFAEFANGFIEMPFVSMITGATAVVLMPVFSKAFHKNNGIDEVMITWRNALSKSAIIIYPIIIYFMVFASEIVVLLYSDTYESSTKYFQIKMLLNFFNIIIFSPLFFSMGKTKMYFLIHFVFSIMIWITHYLIVLFFDNPFLIAINSTFLHILLIITFIYFASYILKIRFVEFFPLKTFGKLILHTLLCIIVIKLIQMNVLITYSNLVQLVLTSIFYGVLLLMTSIFFKLNYLSVIRPLLFSKII